MKIQKKVKQEQPIEVSEELSQDDYSENDYQDEEYSYNEEDDVQDLPSESEMQESKEIIITEKYISTLIKKIEELQQLNAIKSFLKIFKFINTENKESQQENEQKQVKEFYQIQNSEVYTKVMTFAFQSFPKTLRHIVTYNQSNRKTEIIFKVFVTNFFKFMNQSQDQKLIQLAIKSLNLFVDLIMPYPQFIKKYNYFLIEQFCTSDDIQVKLQSFVVLQKILQKANKDNLSHNLKKIYLNILKNSKQVNALNYSLIQFMMNGYIELLQIDPDLSYTLLINFMQQFIIHLKMGYKEKSKENIFMVYNWQIFNCFSLWTKISCQPQFEQLKFGLLQLILSMINIFWTEKYFPLFLKYFALAQQITQKDQFFPIFKFLLKMLSSQNFKQKKQQSNLRKFNFFLNLKVPKRYLTDAGFWNDLFQEIQDLIVLFLADNSKHIYFPEIATMVTRELKQIKKDILFSGYKKKIQKLLQLIQNRNEEIQSLRKERTPQGDKYIEGEDELTQWAEEIKQRKQEQMSSNFKQDEFDIDENAPQIEIHKKNKKKQKKVQPEQPVADEQSSEPSEFNPEDHEVFAGEEELSQDYESLEGDPEEEPNFSDESD